MRRITGTSARRAFTVVDLCASVVLVVLAAFAIAPAIVQSREQSRSFTCADNLRRIAQSALAYADANGAFLPNNQISPFGSWNAQLLDGVGQTAAYDAYSFSAEWWDTAKSKNRQVGATRVGVFQCPSAPHPVRQVHLRDDDAQAFAMAVCGRWLLLLGCISCCCPLHAQHILRLSD